MGRGGGEGRGGGGMGGGNFRNGYCPSQAL